jgi:hypothetical protein
LRPYLVAEVIGRALVAGAELDAPVILTDQRDMLPLALMRPEEVLLVREVTSDIQLAERTSPLIINGCEIIASSVSTKSTSELAALLEPLASNVYLAEPFQRIRAALTEAQLASHDDAESAHDRAAA